jgi:hypothetical protein
MGARRSEIDSTHVGMMSRHGEVTMVIEEGARATQRRADEESKNTGGKYVGHSD